MLLSCCILWKSISHAHTLKAIVLNHRLTFTCAQIRTQHWRITLFSFHSFSSIFSFSHSWIRPMCTYFPVVCYAPKNRQDERGEKRKSSERMWMKRNRTEKVSKRARRRWRKALWAGALLTLTRSHSTTGIEKVDWRRQGVHHWCGIEMHLNVIELIRWRWLESLSLFERYDSPLGLHQQQQKQKHQLCEWRRNNRN